MISVLHILYELRSSGAEIMLKTAAPYMKDKGVLQHVLSTAQSRGDFAEDLSNEGIVIHHIPYSNSLAFMVKFVRLLKQHKFDVVQIHVERTFLTFSILSRLAGVPVIIRTLHSTYLFEEVTRVNRAIRRWIVRLLGVIQVSVSAAIQQNEQKRFRNPTLQINNWYDDAKFYPPSDAERASARKQFNLSDDQKIIISVGNCAPVKNHESIIRAIAMLKKDNVHLVYWHIGEEDAEKKEQKLVYELNLDSIVKFWGKQASVRDFLWAADVFVLPSFHEGLSIAMLEALATQIPIVLAKSTGLEEWGESFSHISYSNTTPEDLAMILQAAQKQDIKCDNEGTYLINNFSIEQGVKKYIALYECKK